MGKTQQGNNNAFCKDNELSWLDWGSRRAQIALRVRRDVAFRRRHPFPSIALLKASLEGSELRTCCSSVGREMQTRTGDPSASPWLSSRATR